MGDTAAERQSATCAGFFLGGGRTSPPPPGHAEFLEAPKKVFGLN